TGRTPHSTLPVCGRSPSRPAHAALLVCPLNPTSIRGRRGLRPEPIRRCYPAFVAFFDPRMAQRRRPCGGPCRLVSAWTIDLGRTTMVRFWTRLGGLVVLGLTVFLQGCNKTDNTTQSADTARGSTGKDDQHAHKPGAHSGTVVPIGEDSYHAEVVFEKNGVLRLYTLGKDESRVLEVQAEPVQAFVKGEGDIEAESTILRPEPQAGDGTGKTSLFVGHLPRDKWGKKIEVTIPNFRIGKERFRVGFSNVQDGHGLAQPKGVAAADEKQLYLEPGGIYSAADIKANGNVTASQKFKGLRAAHDMHPKVGDKICPITETKADPKFSWVVNGRTYE